MPSSDHPVAPPCPLCDDGGGALHHVDAARTYWRCPRCALIHMHPDARPTPMQEVLRYQEHRNDGDDPRYVAFLRRLADPLLSRLAPGACGLDFGCGPSPAMAAILASEGHATHSYDPLFFPVLQEPEAGGWAFITCSEVVEHVHAPRALFGRFAALLAPGGILAVMTRFHGHEAPFARWWYRRDPTHVCFYDERTMAWIASEWGWHVELPAPHVALFRA